MSRVVQETGPRGWLTRGLPRSIVIATLALFCFAGCSSLRIRPQQQQRQQSEQRTSMLQEVQLKVMRYADEYSGALVDPLGRFAAQAQSPEERLAAQNWRLSQATSAYTIASGPNPVINALDMIVLATLSRMVLEDRWVGELYGDRAMPLVNVHRDLEQRAWILVEGVLNGDQLTQLHAVIEEWRAVNPKVRAVAQIRFADFAAVTRSTSRDQSQANNSLFSLIGIDPMKSIDPAVREIEQTRLLAERTIFYVQRAPNLLDMQIERLVYQLAVAPEATRTLADIQRVSTAAEAIGQLANQAPSIIANERHALIEQAADTFLSQQKKLQDLLVETKAMLDAGTLASDSLGDTVKATDAFVARIQGRMDARRATAEAPSSGFDISHYTSAVRETGTSAQELRSLLVQLQSSSAGLEQAADKTRQQLDQLVDHVFWRSVWIIVITAIVLLATILCYRLLLHRWVPAR
ncbi:MAG: hypothetical protein ACJ8MH_09225 [Povalibacter sp.]